MRNRKMDIMKGIAIILMVMGHSGFYYTSFIYLFHMPVFFMISGYLFKLKNDADISDLYKYVLKKIKGIWLPAFIWSTVFICLNNFLLNIGVYTNQPEEILGKMSAIHGYMNVYEIIKEVIKAFVMVGRTELGGAFWFFTTLFGITVLCAVIDFILSKLVRNEKRKDMVHGVIATILCLMGWASNFLNITHITLPVIFSCYILYFLGYILKKYAFGESICALWAIMAFVILVIVYMLGGRYNLGLNQYVNPLCMLLTSFSGWVLLSWLAERISNSKRAYLFEVLGQNTLPIVIHHFWCFKLVHLIQIAIYRYPRKYLASFPYLNADGLWWLCYTAVGVFLPVFLHRGIKRIIHKGKEKVYCNKMV